MTYYMDLADLPYKMIKSKQKKIEMRLDDERRKNININDYIIFTHRDNPSLKLKVLVKNLYRYKSFEELYKHHNKTSIGYLENEIANPKDMEQYYSKDQMEKYGALAIEIELIGEYYDKQN